MKKRIDFQELKEMKISLNPIDGIQAYNTFCNLLGNQFNLEQAKDPESNYWVLALALDEVEALEDCISNYELSNQLLSYTNDVNSMWKAELEAEAIKESEKE
jgi:hypothetical protein